MNAYSLLADLIVAVHVGYVFTIIFGMLFIVIGWIFRWQASRNVIFRTIHLAMITIVVIEALIGMTCPLTDWEYQLRRAAGESVEGGSFVGRMLHNLIFVDFSQETLTVCYCLFGALVLASWVFHRPRFSRKKESEREA